MEEEKINWVDLKLEPSHEEFLEWQKHLIKIVCSTYGVPPCYIVPLHETRWERIKRITRRIYDSCRRALER
jgi:hypothetical protein